MNKKLAKLGAASLLAVGAGSVLMKKNRMKSADPEAKATAREGIKRVSQHRAGQTGKKQQGYLLFQRQLRGICPPGKAGGRG